jgi:hypothetical protein
MIDRVISGLAGGTIYGAIGAGLDSGFTAAGAAIMKAAHHSGYEPGRAAVSGAVGGAVISGGIGLISGLVSPGNVLKASENKGLNLVGSVLSCAVAGVAGDAILTAAGHTFNSMSLGQVAASSAIGTAVIVGGLIVVCGCGRSKN